MRSHVVLAVFKRNFWSYFSGVIGYLFIVAFVFLSEFAAFQEKFFANNVASLEQLNEWFPQLLLFIVPAITMSIWAEERKLGTAELLFTLPVSDLEVLVGKYLAVISVYTVALAFSLTNVLTLSYIGRPDAGLLLTTYLGYWLAGCSLLAAGMVASQLTSNSTVAFVLGSALCAIPVYAGRLSFLVSWFPSFLASWLPAFVVAWLPVFIKDWLFSNPNLDSQRTTFEGLSLSSQFKPFGMGLIPSQGLYYFIALTGLMLYINYVLIGYRHWSGGVKGTNMGAQYFLRAVSMLLILVGVGTVISRIGFRSDWTTERLYSFSPTTQEALKEVKTDRPVTIQAFVSRMPPRDFVAVKSSLMGLLGQYKQATSNVTVRVVEVDPSSEQADEAKQFGIDTRDIQYEMDGTSRVEKVVMGAVVNSGANEVVIPHFGQGSPIEYELTRAIQTVANEKRKTIGILESDLKIGGGFDMATMSPSREWRIVGELKKSYTVENVRAAEPIAESKYDVLVSFLPSSMGMNELTNLVNYVRQGNPVLILDDPLPLMNLGLAPHMPKPKAGGNPMMSMGMPSEQKAFGGKATSLVDLLNIEWIYDETVWDETSLSLHPEYEKLLREEYVSISRESGNPDAFDRKSPVTKSLQEIMLFFAGSIKERDLRKGQEKTLEFQPLLLTGKRSGVLKWEDLVKSSPFGFGGMSIENSPVHNVDGFAHVMAARITSTKDAKGDKVNAIYIADTDLVSDFLMDLRETKRFHLDLDNITFFLNAIDQLAGDMGTIDLRNRRPRHRTLETIEKQTGVFVEETNLVRKTAAEEAKEAVDKARKKLQEKVDSIKNDDSMDDDTKLQTLQISLQEMQRRLEVEEAGINQKRDKEIDSSKSKSEQKSRQVKDRYYTLALLAAPIPAIMLGLIVLLIRINNEQKEIVPTRRVGRRAA